MLSDLLYHQEVVVSHGGRGTRRCLGLTFASFKLAGRGRYGYSYGLEHPPTPGSRRN
jgi:hypothetical protein